ncbi:MarR family winged helix-turn-helix transcriptional regulator [Desulfosporosinus shakirovi]|uniref:MarR family winged helix-turn-helix transcriptional regulator n=1 Tax=Desulfosporosinus shakirovi TaxID=2885154 RepID=UPI001E5C853C|nr:MarR family transcriptional regulator [Desulfosporosinus sp. SRJS8]MCB8818039.1 MarR family transcriptional regulator [Desulfosporosinus sp. SRJS8]
MSKTNSNKLYQALHRLNRQMHRSYHREGHGKGGLYHGQANLLRIILQNDGASQRDLAEQLDVRPSSMTEMLTKLEQSGLILRKQDDKDQRVMRIYLTEEGKKAVEKIAESKDAFVESFFKALTEDEREQLLILTEKLCSDLEGAEDSHGGGTHRGHGSGHHGSCRKKGMHQGHGHHKHQHHHCCPAEGE